MIGAVVLAAGCSRRYGYANKLLANYSGRPVLAHTLAVLNICPVRPVVVVTGADHQRVAALSRRWIAPAARLRIARNYDYRQGLASSLRTGLASLPRRCDRALICLGDMPGLDYRLIQRVIQAAGPGIDTVRPGQAGRPGHPVLISRPLFACLARLHADQGARRVLATVAADRRRRISAPRRCIADIDTPRALRAWRRWAGLPPTA